MLVDLQYAAQRLARALKEPHVRRSVTPTHTRVIRKWAMQDRFNDEQLMQIIQDRLGGLSGFQTGQKYGISESSVKRIMRIYRTGKWTVNLSDHD